MLPVAELNRSGASRYRVRIPEKKRDGPFFLSLQKELLQLDGVRQVRVNPVTGSALFQTDSRIEDVMRLARERSLFEMKKKKRKRKQTVAKKTNQFFEALDEKFLDSSDGAVDVESISFLTLASLAVLQVIRKKEILPPATTLLVYAISAISKKGPDIMPDQESS
jgi:cation transport ATPase